MQKKFFFLDGLRGIAAFYVMAGHARWLLWEGFTNGYSKHPLNYSLVDKILMYFFSIFKWGHECVLFFFVLSGFLIHISYARKFKQDPESTFGFLHYIYKRIKRIYPPFILALLVTLVLDWIGKQYNFSIYFGTTSDSLINSNIGNSDHSLPSFIGNILFLYKEYFPVFGTNGPAWSLKFEWWFYLLYPVFLLFSRKHIYYSTILIIVLFVSSFFPSIWPEQILRDIFSMMICWWLGVLLAEIASGRIKCKLSYFTFCSFLGFAGLFFLSGIQEFRDLQMAFLFTTILSSLLWYKEKDRSLRLIERLNPLGKFSYTLYITHFPILVFLSGVILHLNNNKLPIHSYYIFCGITICLIIAYLSHFMVEKPFLNPKKIFTDEGINFQKES